MYQLYSELYDVEELLALARMDLEKNNYQESLWKIKLALKKCKKGHEAYAMAGRVYAQMGLYDKASKAYEHYVKHNADALLERFQYGMVMFDAGQLVKANTIWQEVLSMSPAYPPALYFKAVSILQEGDKDKAIQAIKELKSVVPAENYYFNLALDLEKKLTEEESPPMEDLSPEYNESSAMENAVNLKYSKMQ